MEGTNVHPRRPRRSSTSSTLFVHAIIPAFAGGEGKATGLSPIAPFMSLTAFVPGLWLCWLSCPKCGRRPSCRRFFLQVLESSPCKGGSAEIFNF